MAKQAKNKLPKELMASAWVLAFGAVAPMLDSTMVNIAINKLQSDLHTSLNTIQWAITGYVLALAIAVPICGYFVNHFNGKKVLQWATIGFGIFSLLSGQAWDVQTFILFRIFQGFSAGFVILLMSTLLMRLAPRDQIGQLMAVVSTPIIIGPIIGPVIGGAIVQYASWQWIFYINVFFCIISLLLNVKFLQDFEPMNPKSRLDWFGTLLLAGGSTGLIYGLMRGSENAQHFFNHEMLIFVTLGVLSFVIYAIYDRLRRGDTVLPMRFFKTRSYLAANAGIFLAGIASNGPMLLLPLYFQNIRDFSVMSAGLILLPQGLGMFLVRPMLGKLIDQLGARPVVLVSLVISLAGTLPFVFIQADTNLWLLGVILFIRGLGIGGLQMPMMTEIFIGLPKSDIASASVGNRIIQNVGASFGSAVISAVVTGVVLSNHITTKVTAHAKVLSDQLMTQATATHTAPTTMALANLKIQVMSYGEHLTKVATLNGYQMGFFVSSVVLVVIAIPAMFMSNKHSA